MAEVQVQVLGPVAVWVTGPGNREQLDLPRRATRLILGILALDANRLVPLDRLIDLVWTDPPVNARDIVYRRISELRGTLARAADGAAELSSGHGGYLLRVAPEDVDAHKFRTLLDRARDAGDDEQARQLLRAALDLWHGPVLAGSPPARPHGITVNLEATRRTALEDLFDIELRLGHEVAVVGEILDVYATAAEPSERLAGQVMLALSRTDRRLEALTLYDQYWRRLRDDYGVSPGADLQRIHRSILDDHRTGRPSGDEPTAPTPVTALTAMGDSRVKDHPVPQTLPAAIPDFTGRAKEITELIDVLTRPDPQGVRVATVTGPGGVGKTALCLHVAHRLRPHFPDGQLYVDLRAMEDGEPVSAHLVLGRFLRALGLEAPPDSPEARLDMYRSLVADRRILVVVDNAADTSQVIPLIPGSVSSAVLVNGRGRLTAPVGAHALALPVLERDEGIALLSRIAGNERIGVEPQAATELIQLCGDLPLAIRVVGARLAARPHWSLARMVERLADERERLRQLSFGQLDVRSSLALSYRGLPTPARRLLRRLGDLGVPEVKVWTAAALLDASVVDAEEVLEALFDAQLLDIAGREVTGHSRYRLHDLVRLLAGEYAADDEELAELAAARTRAFGAWLDVAEAARRRFVGGPYRLLHSNAQRWPVPASLVDPLVAEPLAWAEAERQSLLGMVRRCAEVEKFDAAWDLAYKASVLLNANDLYDDCQAVLEAAAPIMAAPGQERGRAALLYRQGDLLLDRREIDAGARVLQEAAAAFEQAGEPYGQALCLVTLGIALRWVEIDKPDASLRYSADALPALRAHPDPVTEALALRSMGQAYMQLGQLAEAEEHMTAALDAARRAGSTRSQVQVQHWLGELRLQQGRVGEAEPLFRAVIDYGYKSGEYYGAATGLNGLGLYYLAVGEPRQAREALTEAQRLLQRLPGRDRTPIGRRTAAVLAELDAADEEERRPAGPIWPIGSPGR